MLTHPNSLGVNNARNGFKFLISLAEQNMPPVYSVPMQDDDLDILMDLTVLLFGVTRDAIRKVDDRMTYVLLPNTNPRDEYKNYYYEK